MTMEIAGLIKGDRVETKVGIDTTIKSRWNLSGT